MLDQLAKKRCTSCRAFSTPTMMWRQSPATPSSSLVSSILLSSSYQLLALSLLASSKPPSSDSLRIRIGDWTRLNRFRNRIRFYFNDDREEGLVHVEIRSLVSHMEVRCLTDAVINPRLILECRRQLWSMFYEVCSLYPHTRDVLWDFGFYCPHAVQSGRRPHPARCHSKNKPQHVICSMRDCQGGPVGLENKHKCWFTVSACSVVYYCSIHGLCVYRRLLS